MTFLKTHLPCETCGSSDGLSINDDMSTKCFVCNTYIPSMNKERLEVIDVDTETKDTSSFLKEYNEGYSVSVADRRINKTTMERYGVVRSGGYYFFPYYDGNLMLKLNALLGKPFFRHGYCQKVVQFF